MLMMMSVEAVVMGAVKVFQEELVVVMVEVEVVEVVVVVMVEVEVVEVVVVVMAAATAYDPTRSADRR